MSWLQRLPLRRKLTALTLLTSGAALVGAMAACFAFGLTLARWIEVRDVQSLAEVLGRNAGLSLAKHDADAAATALEDLKSRPDIAAARLVTPEGADLARFTRNDSRAAFLPIPTGGDNLPSSEVHRFHIYISQPVMRQGKREGTLQVTADVRGELGNLAGKLVWLCLLVLAAALLFSYFVAASMQRAITSPLFALAATSRRVALDRDYALRAPKSTDDEIGDLADAFNQMLAEVQDRDLALQKAQRELSDQYRALERESAARLAAQEERRELERKLEETQRLESLGVLAGGIAHDFNNILTGILCSASLARLDAAAGSELDHHLERVEQNSRRAAELCEQMLAYAGKARVLPRAVDLNTLVRDTLELLHASVPKDAELTVQLEPDLPSVLCDGGRLRQVLMNLVINAAEALQSPPRRITLVTRRRTLEAGDLETMTHPGDAAPGDHACISVSDTGVGIASDHLRRIFEPFYSSKFTGRGLGLSAVLGIIRGNGGALNVTSEQGRGTTFCVYFPASSRVVPPAGDLPALSLDSLAHTGRGSILLVDDEASVRDVGSAALRKMGFEVVECSDGVSAVERLHRASEPFAAVLLDLTMPGMDGATTLQALRAVQPDLPVFLMSGYDQADTMRRYRDLHASGFLQKPFSVETLRDCIVRLNEGAAAK